MSMIPVRHFDSAEDLLAHYRSLGQRLNSDRRPAPQTTRPSLAVVPVKTKPQPVAPQPSVGELLDSFRLVCQRKIEKQAAALEQRGMPVDEIPPPRITIKLIAEFVSVAFSISVLDLMSQRRMLILTKPRHAMFWLARHLTGRSLPDIGRRCGGRDHTTILHGVHRCDDLMKRDPGFKEMVLSIRERLEALV